MNRILFIVSIVLLLSFSSCSPTVQEYVSNEITTQEIQQHIKYLSSDKLGGRKSGEEGNRLAAEYIANQFKNYGLIPAGDDKTYFQNFSFISTMKVGPNNKLVITANDKPTALTVNEQYKPLLISADTLLHSPIVFVGYGITAPDSMHYNDYADIDVKNKIVMMMRYSPDTSVYSKYALYASTMAKLFTARDKGAAGVIMLTAPPGERGDNFIASDDPRLGSSSIAITSMKWSSAEAIMTQLGIDLKQVKHTIDSTTKPNSFELKGTSASLQTQIEKVYAKSANVLGYLAGTDSILKNEVLVVGAHFDHLGMGGEGSGSLKPDTLAIHHGADDNASGTAGLLEVAQYLSSQAPKLKRTVLFIAFTGEELGVLGSDYYVKHPYFALDKSITMINMDMIGRMKDSVLVIQGMGTSPEFENLVKSENKDFLSLSLQPDGFGPSDQASFYKKDMPVIFFFTNLESDYHKPSDTWEKINYTGEQKIVQMASRVAMDLINSEKRPAFTKVISTTQPGQGDRPAARVTLGIIPDFAGDTPGMKISGARPGSPAEKAGLKADDVITKFGGKDIKNIYDFTYMLGQFKPGDEVEIVVKRGNQEVVLKAKLEAKQ